MVTASTNIMQEEWVQRWLDKLTPKQQALVIEVLKDFKSHRKPSPAAIAQAESAVTNSDRKVAASTFPATTEFQS
jgi:hypothetical protein